MSEGVNTLEDRMRELEDIVFLQGKVYIDRIATLEIQVAGLATQIDTLTDKLIEAGVLVKRKGKE